MRTMSTEKLIKTLPIIQNQLDALLDFQVLSVCVCVFCIHKCLHVCLSKMRLCSTITTPVRNGATNSGQLRRGGTARV